jgi:DNA-binding GntR family transcriptional regulator
VDTPDGERPATASLAALTPHPTTAARAAEAIRAHIFQGRVTPGSALPETALARALGVSRNTVREALRTLVDERLLSYEAHRGVTVRRPTPDDVRDIYALRRVLELAAVDALGGGRPGGPALDRPGLLGCLADGESAASSGDWLTAGTANLRLHARIVAGAGSPRTDEVFARLMTELRLGFLAVPDPRALHRPYLRRNRTLVDLLLAGRFDRARDELAGYLDDAARRVVGAMTPGGAA